MTRPIAIAGYVLALCSAAALVVGVPVQVVGLAVVGVAVGIAVGLALASVRVRRARG